MTTAPPDTSELTLALRGFRIDRSSPIPLYFQVSAFIEEAIESWTVPNGSLFANEIQLAEQLGLSRPTIRRAMQDLVDKGLIVRRRGIGTRVVQPKVRRPLELSSLYDDLSGSGQAPTTEVLEVAWVPCDDEVAGQLGVPAGIEGFSGVQGKALLNVPPTSRPGSPVTPRWHG